MELCLAGLVEVLIDSLIIWKICNRSYFLSCFVVIPNLKDMVFGGVYGMDETSDFEFAIIVPLKYIIGHGPWGRATNN